MTRSIIDIKDLPLDPLTPEEFAFLGDTSMVLSDASTKKLLDVGYIQKVGDGYATTALGLAAVGAFL